MQLVEKIELLVSLLVEPSLLLLPLLHFEKQVELEAHKAVRTLQLGLVCHSRSYGRHLRLESVERTPFA